MVNIIYFARLRETLGRGSEQIELPPDVRDVRALRAYLGTRGERWARELADEKRVRVAVNQEMANPTAPISANDEIAFFPPVTGG